MLLYFIHPILTTAFHTGRSNHPQNILLIFSLKCRETFESQFESWTCKVTNFPLKNKISFSSSLGFSLRSADSWIHGFIITFRDTFITNGTDLLEIWAAIIIRYIRQIFSLGSYFWITHFHNSLSSALSHSLSVSSYRERQSFLAIKLNTNTTTLQNSFKGKITNDFFFSF